MKKLWFKKKSHVHGSGLFTVQNIKKGTKIIEYIGDKVTKKEGDKRAVKQIKQYKKNNNNGMVYVFELNKLYDIDGFVVHNHAKLINHSCNPNCEVEIIKNEIWISAIKNINHSIAFIFFVLFNLFISSSIALFFCNFITNIFNNL